eukprot:854849-Pyramimonas_sp.AAC.1
MTDKDREKEEDATRTASMALDILNGDWRGGRISHWCWDAACPCRRDADKLNDLVVTLLERL